MFSPFTLGTITTRNRTALAPMTRTSAESNGLVSERMVPYYTRFAKGGFGLIITEGTYPDKTYSQAYANQPGIADDEQAHSWKPVIEAVHREESFIFCQLMHAGALVQQNPYTQNRSIAPSAVKPKGNKLEEHGGSGEFDVPREITRNEIEAVIESFAQSAFRAKSAGFDGVEVHGANGYLLDQFITDYSNLRTDEYGGSPENRIRLSIQILNAIREAVGPNFTVGIRISQSKVNDFHHKWKGGEAEAKMIFESLSEAQPDYIHTTEYQATQPAFVDGGPTLAALAKKYSGLPVIANGKLGDPDIAESMIKSGEADLIAIGTTALVNPDWIRKVEKGLPLKPFSHDFLHPHGNIRDDEVVMA